MTRPHLAPTVTWTLLLLLAAAFSLGGLALTSRDPVVVERQVAGRPIQVPGAGYLSSDVCRSCHPSQYASWHRSYHRTMTQTATPATVAASFDGVTVDAVPGSPIRLERRGAELWADFDDPDDGGPDDGGQTGGRTGGTPPGPHPRLAPCRQVA